MKIKITYQTEEELEQIMAAVKSVYTCYKVRKSSKYAPYFHVYISIGNTKKT